MKLIGLRKEIDKTLENYRYENSPGLKIISEISEEEKKLLLNYLNNGKVVFTKTLAVCDGDHYINPYMLHSDGEWIWPSYFSFYLSKEDFANLDKVFLASLRTKEFKIVSLSEEQIREVTTFIEKKLLGIL